MSMYDDRVRQLVSDALGRVHTQLERELTDLVGELRALADSDREQAAREARVAAESAAAALASEAIAAERASAEDRLAHSVAAARDAARAEWEHELAALRQELAEARTAQSAERQIDLEQADRLIGAVRELDEAASLTEVLDLLVRTAGRAAGRAAVFLVRNDLLTGWAQDGFPPEMPPAREIELHLTDAGLLADALRDRTPRATGGADGRRHDEIPEALRPGSPDRVGLAVPLTVDGRDVAVLYADDADEAPRMVPSAWPEQVELLARHAGRCLEAITARQAFRARARPAASNGRREDEAAERYARLLISEIKLYHEPLVEEGRRMGDLLRRLRPQIERARSLYEERVPIDVRARADFFDRELVRTLAGGDAERLGQAV